MKMLVRHAVAAMTVAVACQAGIALAGDLSQPTGSGTTAVNPSAAPSAPMPCSYYYEDAKPAAPAPTDADCTCNSCGECENCCCGCCCTQASCSAWTVDWLVRPYFDSHTSYQFGTHPASPVQYAPLSKLNWSLDSTWTGLRLGRETATRGFHFEWLTPMQNNINGQMADFDWLTPADPSQLDSLTLSDLRWRDAQMIDLGGEFKWSDCMFGMPIEIWPMMGFRWQRFSMVGSGIDYIVPPLGPDPAWVGRDVITFSQQYYMLYLGGQLRTNLCVLGRNVDFRFQGDWAPTWGYNSDHHLSYEDIGIHRYTMEKTAGGAMHLALIAETQVTDRLWLGLSADHLALTTWGQHRWLMSGAATVDETWTNGVMVRSDQTSITAFLRARF